MDEDSKIKEDLKIKREMLEIERLEMEIKVLKHPMVHNPGYIIVAIITAAGLATAFINWDTVKKREKLDMELQRVKQEIVLKNEEISRIQENIISYRREADNLREANISIRALASQKEGLTPEEERKIVEADNANYLVSYLAYNVSEQKHKKIEDFLQNQGYNILRKSVIENHKPDWFSSQSTVLYYDESTQEKAESIAKNLEDNTGVKFIVVKGAGKGVQKSLEKWSFIIHHIE